MLRLLSHLPLMVILAGVGALAMLVPAAYAAALEQDELARIFAMSSAVSLVLIAVTALATAAAPAGDTTRTMLLTMLGTMVLLPVMLAVPVLVALPDTGLFNAWWEMVSCLTTTGASLYSAEALPAPLHLWRALVGWMGGLFMLVAAISIMAPLRIGGFEIMSSPYQEGGPQRGQGLHVAPAAGASDPVMRVLRAGRDVFPVYAGLTLGLWMLLLMLGDTGPMALSRAMGTLSTSGIAIQTGHEGQVSGIPGEIAIFVFLIPALSRRFWPGAESCWPAKAGAATPNCGWPLPWCCRSLRSCSVAISSARWKSAMATMATASWRGSTARLRRPGGGCSTG
ncbi:hypothetical protein PE067_05840 [Paracoccus sp. DMF-8]|uniref:hypothetical protein n=1 Tax=Paracoccus sp. DMF-8 TaxID=3019445 RepID=UPI0023E8609D|nr:hypothetical protein [Paracoccus sp. DMF-8]MDF3605713.1 hypothetical protein [Paracoccus sp. DMF-8]